MIIPEIELRRSIRSYQEKKVEPDKLERILEAARLAPSAKNRQDWKLLIITDPVIKTRLIDKSAAHQPFMHQASIIIVACALNPDYLMRCGQAAYPIDLAIVLDHLSLQAVREGLGTCWIGSFDEEPVREVLVIPAGIRVVELMTLGYPQSIPPARERKRADELVGFEKW